MDESNPSLNPRWGTFLGTGLIQTGVGYPFELLKTRSQVYSRYRLVEDIWTLYRRRGIMGFYRGCRVPLVVSTVSNEILFHQYTSFHKEYGSVLSGFLAGMMVSVPMQPFEVMKTNRQCDRPMTWKTLCQNGDWKKGWSWLCMRESVGGSVYFGSFSYLREKCDWSVATAGGCAGVLSWAMTYPFDLKKTYCQVGRYNNPNPRQYLIGFVLIICRSWVVNSCIFSALY